MPDRRALRLTFAALVGAAGLVVGGCGEADDRGGEPRTGEVPGAEEVPEDTAPTGGNRTGDEPGGTGDYPSP